MRVTMEGGLRAGCRAFGRRFVQCRPHYSVRYDYPSRNWMVILADGSTAASAEMADFVIEPYQRVITSVEARMQGISG
jgi:hypothetical protein